MITEIYYTATGGLSYLILPEISNVTILTVARGGKILTEVSSSPVGLEFKYTSSGRIDVDANIPFGGGESSTTDVETETIYIKYKV